MSTLLTCLPFVRLTKSRSYCHYVCRPLFDVSIFIKHKNQFFVCLFNTVEDEFFVVPVLSIETGFMFNQAETVLVHFCIYSSTVFVFFFRYQKFR